MLQKNKEVGYAKHTQSGSIQKPVGYVEQCTTAYNSIYRFFIEGKCFQYVCKNELVNIKDTGPCKHSLCPLTNICGILTDNMFYTCRLMQHMTTWKKTPIKEKTLYLKRYLIWILNK